MYSIELICYCLANPIFNTEYAYNSLQTFIFVSVHIQYKVRYEAK